MGVFTDEALTEYCRAFREPACIAATCEDYRASAGIDLLHDSADQDCRMRPPLLALWGTKGLVGNLFDVLASWSAKASTVSGQGFPVGHFLPEEAPNETAEALVSFFTADE